MSILRTCLKLSRCREYYGNVVLTTLIGFYVVGTDFWSGFIILTANFLNAAFAYMINDIEDAHDDALDPDKRKRNLISSGELSKRDAQIVTFAVGFASVGLYSLFNNLVFLIGFSGIFLGFLYSHKRFRLKSKPVVDITSHGVFMALVYFLAAIYTSTIHPPVITVLWLGIPIYFISVLSDIHNEIRDYEVDRKAGLRNTLSFVRPEHLKGFLTYPTFVLILTAALYILINSGSVMRLFLLFSLVVTALHYRFRFKSKNEGVFYYPHRQKLFVVIGFALIARPAWERANELLQFIAI